MLEFDSNYEVCNCKKVTISDIELCLKKRDIINLRDIQDMTGAGTECRHCIFEAGDFGKVKKKIYCKDILEDFKKVVNG